MKKDAYYFSHDANAQDDPKCMLLIDQMGMEGYGIFWGLIEKLRQEPGYKLPTIILPSLAKRWGTSTEKVQTVVSRFGLFVMEEDGFFSERLRRSMEMKSESARLNALKRWQLSDGNATAMRPHSDGNAIGMLLKERKGKEKKVNKKGFIAPSVLEVEEYFDQNGFTKESGKRAWEYYEAGGWTDSRGQKVVNWKQKVRVVWFKPENKKPDSQTEILKRSYFLFEADYKKYCLKNNIPYLPE